MTAWFRDLRYASRALRANQGFTISAFVTMTVAMAATTAVFSVVNAVLLRPLPVPGADRVVAVGTVTKDAPETLRTASLEEIDDWRRQSKTLAAFGAWRDWGMLRYDGARRESVYGIVATPALFDALALRPALGRPFAAADDRPGAPGVALLADSYWRQWFGADPDVIGKTLVLERGPKAAYAIVGVLPPAFNEIPSFARVLVVVPSPADPDARSGRAHRNRMVFARLRDGTSLGEARIEMGVIAARLAAEYPANADRLVRVLPAIEAEVGPTGDTLRAFFAAVALLLLIASANVAGLQLARAMARQREFAVRRALGGTRRSLVRALVSETAILSVCAGLAALVASRWLVELVLTLGPTLPRGQTAPFDARVFGFTVFVCVMASLMLALPAALLSTRVDLAQALKEQSAQAGRSALRARRLFVAAQAALALMLLVGAGSATRALLRQLSIDPGFDPAGLASMTVYPPTSRYPEAAAVVDLYSRLVEAARAVPGVTAASAVSATPLSGEGAEPAEFVIRGQAVAAATRPTVNVFNVAPGYFHVLAGGLRAGRDFDERDRRDAPPAGIVNETFVRRYLGSADPLGTVIGLGPAADPVRVIGVAPDLLQEMTPRAVAQPELYIPYSQRARWATFLVVRAERSPAATAAAVRERIAGIDPEIRVGTPALMSDRLHRSARGPKFVSLLFGLFSAIALLLSAIGTAGLVLYTTAQRSRELAVRVSLGATVSDVIRVVASGALTALAAGTAAGLAGSVVVSRALSSLLRDLDPIGPGLVLAAAALFICVGAVACYVPARRAALTDPASVMRA